MRHIAQEVKAIFPELILKIEHEGEAILMLSVNQFIPILVSSIQEQSKIIDDLTARIK